MVPGVGKLPPADTATILIEDCNLLSAINVDRFLADKPLALTMSGLEELRAHILARVAVFDSAPKDFLAALVTGMQAAAGEQKRQPRGVGVIPIRGTISQHAQGDLSSLLFGGTTTEGVSQALAAFVEDDAIGKIVLDIHSPGGSTYGVAELAAEIRGARGKKPIVAVANSQAGSAAYWLGASADQFFASPGALVGSIGVYALHMDVSEAAAKEGVKPSYISAGEFKVEGNQFEPLSDEARAHAQSMVDDAYGQFVTDVARGRGVSEATVRNSYGKGRMYTAKQAKAAGMIDGIMTLAQAIARPMNVVPRQVDGQAAEAELAGIQAIDEEGLKRLALIRWRALEERAAV